MRLSSLEVMFRESVPLFSGSVITQITNYGHGSVRSVVLSVIEMYGDAYGLLVQYSLLVIHSYSYGSVRSVVYKFSHHYGHESVSSQVSIFYPQLWPWIFNNSLYFIHNYSRGSVSSVVFIFHP